MESMRRRSTEELLAIWARNDRSQWSGAAFEAIALTLRERAIELPRQAPRIAERTPQPVSASVMATRPSIFRRLLTPFRNIAVSSHFRQSLTIGAGVFLGLLAMRIVSMLWRYWNN